MAGTKPRMTTSTGTFIGVSPDVGCPDLDSPSASTLIVTDGALRHGERDVHL